MALTEIIKSVLGEENFGDYEQNVYDRHQEMAEKEIITRLNELLGDPVLLTMLKQYGAKCACRFVGYREITVRLKSGKSWQVNSPVFIRAQPPKKRSRKPARQKKPCVTWGWRCWGFMNESALVWRRFAYPWRYCVHHMKLQQMRCGVLE